MVTMTIQTIAIDGDLDVDTSPGRVTDRDLAWWHGRSWDRRRDSDSTRTSTCRCRNDVTFMITVTVQAAAIDGDLDEKAS